MNAAVVWSQGRGVCCGLWWHYRGGDGNRDGTEHDWAGSEGIGRGSSAAAGSPAGAGRKPAIVTDPTLMPDLEALVEPTTRGDPQSPLRWTCKSVRRLAQALQAQGH